MAKPKKASPGVGVGHNSGAAQTDPRDMMRALAVYILDEEEAAKLREKRKLHSKAAQGKNVSAEDVKFMFSIKDLTGSELEQQLNRMILRISAVNPDLGQQLDLYVPKATTVQKAAYRQTGMMAAIKGVPFQAPPGLSGDSLQELTDGYNIGAEYRQAAEDERLEEMKKAIAKAEAEKKADKPVSEPAAKVAEKAQKDFVADNGAEALTVAGEVYPNMRAANAARKRLKEQEEAAAAAAASEPAAAPTPASDEAPVAPAAGDGEHIAGPAPAGTVYMLASDEAFASGRQATYKDGKEFDTGAPGEFPIYDTHPAEPEADPTAGMSQSEKADYKRKIAGLN
jgi:hypothetical protein